MGRCRRFIERRIEFDNNVSRYTLIDLVNNRFGKHYGFNEKHKQIAKQLIDIYCNSHQRVLEMRNTYPDDIVLIQNLTGVNLENSNNLNVFVGPMTIDIITDGPNSKILLERAYYKEFNERPKHLDNLDIFNFGGFAFFTTKGDNTIFYTVINRDIEMKGYLNDGLIQKILDHEHEHQKNRIFREVLGIKFDYINYEYIISQYNEHKDPFTKQIILEEFFYLKRSIAFEKVKDEIIASLCDRLLPELAIQLSVMFFSQDGNAYDYLAYLRDSDLKKDDILYKQLSEKILVKEYRFIIEKSVYALFKLINEGGYSQKEVIALLIDKPLSDWYKTVNRLLEWK